MIKREATGQMLEVFDSFYYKDDIRNMDKNKSKYEPEITKLKRLSSLIGSDEDQEDMAQRVYNEMMDNLFAIGSKENQRVYLLYFISEVKGAVVVFSKYGQEPKVNPGNLKPGDIQPGDLYDIDLEYETNVIIESMMKEDGDNYYKKLRGLRKSYEEYVIRTYFFKNLIYSKIFDICALFELEYSELSKAPGVWGNYLHNRAEQKPELSTRGIVLLYHYWALHDPKKNVKYLIKEIAEKFGKSRKSLENTISKFDYETLFSGNIHPKTRVELMNQLIIILSILAVECKPAHDEALKDYTLLSK